MAWIAITEDMVKTRMAGAELNAVRTAALSAGQADPLTEVVTECVNEVRGYVAGCKANRLELGAKVPEKLKAATLARIVFELASRLPVKGLVTEERKTADRDAKALLRLVSQCDFAIEEPVTIDPEKVQNPSPKIVAPCLKFTQQDQDGL